MSKQLTILIADDDEDDRLMTKEALEEGGSMLDIQFVEDGAELLDYLLSKNKYANNTNNPKPDLILLDLNMPKMDGREALAKIKGNPDLKCIPVVVMTTSKANEDIQQTYDLGVNSFIKKPVSFNVLVDILKNVTQYWFGTVELPK